MSMPPFSPISSPSGLRGAFVSCDFGRDVAGGHLLASPWLAIRKRSTDEASISTYNYVFMRACLGVLTCRPLEGDDGPVSG
jgi:hypothetical protein